MVKIKATINEPNKSNRSVEEVIGFLDSIYSEWLSRSVENLAQSGNIQDHLSDQLSLFFSSLKESLQDHKSLALFQTTDEWIDTLTETDIESQHSSIIPILSRLFIQIIQVSKEYFSDRETNILMLHLFPLFMRMIEHTTSREVERATMSTRAELEEAQAQLKRLDKSKSDFISIAAHELKTPLTLIQGYTAILKETLNESEPKISADILIKGIETGACRLREIIDDMIDVSLIDNEMLSLSYQPIWIDRMIENIVDEFEAVVHSRNLNLKFHRFHGCDEMLFGDPERLLQAIRNIVTNGIKFTPDGGKITIEGRILPGFVEIVVKDTGIGIALEDQGVIFEKFGRIGSNTLHSSSKTGYKGGGPGLGLPIAKGIIEAHGGTIWVESEGYDEIKCPGSAFHILLPLHKQPPDDHFKRILHLNQDNEVTLL